MPYLLRIMPLLGTGSLPFQKVHESVRNFLSNPVDRQTRNQRHNLLGGAEISE